MITPEVTATQSDGEWTFPDVNEDHSDLSSYPKNLILDRIINNLELSLTIPVHGVTSLAGVVTNLLNVAVLPRLGFHNSMAVGVFALTCTDLLVTSLQLALCFAYLFENLFSSTGADYVLAVYVMGWLRYAGFYISTWITTVISVERCLCVVAPFEVKRWFTKRRCCLVIAFIYVAYLALIFPIFVNEKITWNKEGKEEDLLAAIGQNKTSLSILEPFVERSPLTVRLEEMIDTIGAVCLSLLSQAILIVCTLWMVYSLKASSAVRQTLTDQSGKSPPSRSSPAAALSPRERKLVKVVLWLTAVLTACNIPRYTVLAAHHLVPGMIIGAYPSLSLFMWDVSDFFGTVNCSSSFVVYWMLNSKFRIAFYQRFNLMSVKK